jgi:hypothetical protein
MHGPESVVGPPGTTPTVPCRAVRIATWMWTGVRDDLTAANKAGRPCLLHKLSRPTPLSQFAVPSGLVGLRGGAGGGRKRRSNHQGASDQNSEERALLPGSRTLCSVGSVCARPLSVVARPSCVTGTTQHTGVRCVRARRPDGPCLLLPHASDGWGARCTTTANQRPQSL